MMLRGGGHLLDHHDPRDFGIDRLIGSGFVSVPTSYSLREHVRLVRDQGVSNSCVGQSLAAAVEVCAHRDGIVIPPVSELAIYTGARYGSGLPGRLFDLGCRPREALDFVTRRGVVAQSRWPLLGDTLNERLPWDVVARGADARVTGYYRLGEAGYARGDALRRAIASGIPVCCAVLLDRPFDNYSDGILGAYDTASVRGSHYVLVVGFGPGYFEVLNSWGDSWGRGGYASLSDERIQDSRTTDFIAITVAPPEVG